MTATNATTTKRTTPQPRRLRIVDYATGAETFVAENVHGAVVDDSGDPDGRLAAGTRVAFIVRNRIASPYDVVWAYELP